MPHLLTVHGYLSEYFENLNTSEQTKKTENVEAYSGLKNTGLETVGGGDFDRFSREILKLVKIV